MSRVELPSGGWVEFKERQDIIRQDRKDISRAFRDNEIDDATDIIAVILIKAWSFGDAVTVERLSQVPNDDWNVIDEHLADMLAALPTNIKTPSPDPKAHSAS